MLKAFGCEYEIVFSLQVALWKEKRVVEIAFKAFVLDYLCKYGIWSAAEVQSFHPCRQIFHHWFDYSAEKSNVSFIVDAVLVERIAFFLFVGTKAVVFVHIHKPTVAATVISSSVCNESFFCLSIAQWTVHLYSSLSASSTRKPISIIPTRFSVRIAWLYST